MRLRWMGLYFLLPCMSVLAQAVPFRSPSGEAPTTPQSLQSPKSKAPPTTLAPQRPQQPLTPLKPDEATKPIRPLPPNNRPPIVPPPATQPFTPRTPVRPPALPGTTRPMTPVIPLNPLNPRTPPQARPEIPPGNPSATPPLTLPDTDLIIGASKQFDFSQTRDSFRIATYNTHLLSPVFNKAIIKTSHANKDAESIAQSIAENAIHEKSFDVIALNEVWDEHAKDILASRLSSTFPYYVKSLDAPGGTVAQGKISDGVYASVPKVEDSGLMLFSKLPLSPFHTKTASSKVDRAFHYFDACGGVDAAAAKGVGVVVFANPETQWRYIVAFTHLQNEDHDIMRQQMDEIATFLMELHSVNPEWKRGETFLMGDLNIVGHNLPDAGKNWENNSPPSDLWAKLFWTNKQSYFVYPLYDAWAWTTSPFDLGFTSPSGNGRIDYIIHDNEDPSTMYAMQHMHHVVFPKSNSDHTCVAADLNRRSPACVPRVARQPELNTAESEGWWDCQPFTGEPGQPLSGKLEYPGSMQWFRFNTGGTYSIGLSTDEIEAGLSVSVYEATDLTTPLAVYNEESKLVLLGKDPVKYYQLSKYHVGTPPFYVRVSNPSNRAWHGNYGIAFHRHVGANKDDAITLLPCEPAIDPKMPLGKPLNGDDAVWFEFCTDQAHSGKAQNLAVNVTNTTGSSLTLDLLEEDPSNTEATIQLKTSTPVMDPSYQAEEVGGKKYYLTLKRENTNQQGFTLGWTTNLTWMVGITPGITWPFKLVCTDETGVDWTGTDEVDFTITADNEPSPYSFEQFDGIDTDDHIMMEGILQPVAFVESIDFRLKEKEVGPDEVGTASQGTLDIAVPEQLRRWVDVNPDDGNYEFRFSLTHSLKKNAPPKK